MGIKGMNPLTMMRLKTLLESFKTKHPKITLFFSAASNYIGIDSVLELTVTTTDGKSLCTNMKVTQEDLELLQLLKEQIAAK